MDVIDLGKIVVNNKKVGAPSMKKSKNEDGAPKKDEELVQPIPTKRQTRGMKKKAEEGIKTVTQDDEDDKKVKAATTTKSSKEMVDEEWDCPACTFKNKAKSMCEMCETPKPRVLLPVVKEWEMKMIASRKKDESEKEIKFNGTLFFFNV